REILVAIDIALNKHGMEQKLKESETELIRHRKQLALAMEERTAELQSSTELLREEITDRRTAEAEAIRSGQLAALGELAAGVAHEINNPINGIINYAQMLLNRSGGDSMERDIASRIIKESDRIADIVKNLLLFAREGREEKYPLKIHDIISEALSLTGAQLNNDGIKLQTDIPDDLPRIIAQRQQLEQVFLNVISNARYALNQKYPGTHENKILEIRCQKIMIAKKPYVRIVFFDRGPGIPSALLDKVVDPFYSTKPSSVGTGLGLSISHSIIKNHRGKLFIESTEGEYTKITIDLPAEEQ
ncbi:MAG: ATP-binding protein, partial [Nitrospirota bacterium]